MKDFLGPFKLGMVHEGDSLNLLGMVPDVKGLALVTDPPYGIGVKIRSKNRVVIGDETTAMRDAVIASRAWYAAAVFGSPKVSRPEGWHTVLIWSKGPFVGMGDLKYPWKLTHEEICLLGDRKAWIGKRAESVLKSPALFPNLPAANARRGELYEHPTQKPVSLMMDIIERLQAEVIIDPFAGSGATGVACVRLGRKFLGFEIDPKWASFANERLVAARAGLSVKEHRLGQVGLWKEER